MQSSEIQTSLPLTTDADTFNTFLAGNLSLLFILGNSSENHISSFKDLIPPNPNKLSKLECDGSSLQTTQELLNLLYQHLDIPLPTDSHKVTQQLQYIYSTTKRKERHFHFIIFNTHKIPLSVLAAISHLTLLQEGAPTISTLILADQKLIKKTTQLGLKRFPCINLDNIDIENKSNHPLAYKLRKQINLSILQKIRLQTPSKAKWLLKPQFIAATLTTCFVSISLFSKYERDHFKKKNSHFLPHAISVRHTLNNTTPTITLHTATRFKKNIHKKLIKKHAAHSTSLTVK